VPDFETTEGGGIGKGGFGVLLNMRAQFTLANGFEERAHFMLFAGRQELDPAVRQIAHRTSHVEALGNLPDRVTKTDALDVAFVKDLDGCSHAIRRLNRPDAGGNRPGGFIEVRANPDRAIPPEEPPDADRPNSN
jgi:hypothetical protein